MGDYQAQSLWQMRLGFALRTALACTIVDCTVLYGPPQLKKYITYPSFSYMTTILIAPDTTLGDVMRSCWHVIFATTQVLLSSYITYPSISYMTTILIAPDATLGDVMRSCWHVIFATAQVLLSSVLTLWLVEPKNFTVEVAAVAVALSAFVVALPESTHLLSKRIAFGQFVIVYVGTVIHGAQTGVVMHPLGVASSTALGAFASVVAMLFPYPRLSYYEVSKSWRMYAGNASQRLACFVEAISSRDKSGALEFLSRGQSLSKKAAKLLQSISNNLETMVWERPLIKFQKPNYLDSGERLQEIEVPLRGMEIALSSCNSHPVKLIDEELRRNLQISEVEVSLRLLQAKYSLPSDATLAPESYREIFDKPLWAGKPTTNNRENLLLVLHGTPPRKPTHCLESLGNTRKPNQQPSDSQNQRRWNFKTVWRNIIPSTRSIIFALKCSLALCLAMLFGLLYNKENGYWSGLAIAISFVTGRQATFTVTKTPPRVLLYLCEIKSLPVSETMSESDYHDSELGKPPRGFATLGCTDDKEVETIVSSFLQHFDSEEKHKSQMVLCLTSLGFCIPSVMRETMEMKKEVRKLVKLNAPT
ncbi:unnamed protein product [Malus baccata var. baccata]